MGSVSEYPNWVFGENATQRLVGGDSMMPNVDYDDPDYEHDGTVDCVDYAGEERVR